VSESDTMTRYDRYFYIDPHISQIHLVSAISCSFTGFVNIIISVIQNIFDMGVCLG